MKTIFKSPFSGIAVIGLILIAGGSEALAGSNQKTALKFPMCFERNNWKVCYGIEDFRVALEIARERRIEKEEIKPCSPGPAAQAQKRAGVCYEIPSCTVFPPAMQPAMKAAGKCLPPCPIGPGGAILKGQKKCLSLPPCPKTPAAAELKKLGKCADPAQKKK